MKDRILYLITMLCNGSNLEFSQKTGINNATLSNLKKEKTNPTLDMVYKIQNAYPDIDLYLIRISFKILLRAVPMWISPFA